MNALHRAPTVSAVIPTRSRPALVLRAVKSALNQTYSDMEVVVVVDGTCPATTRMLAQVDDSRLRVVETGQPVGGASARNCGVEAARGEWIAFLDDDDEWMPGKIEAQLCLAKACGDAVPVIAGRVLARSPISEFIWPTRLPASGEPISEYLFVRRSVFKGEGLIQTSTLMAPRSLLRDVPFTAGLTRHQDWDWVLRACVRRDVVLRWVDAPIAIWHVEDGRVSISSGAQWRSSFEWLRRIEPLMTPRARAGFISTVLAAIVARDRAFGAVPVLIGELARTRAAQFRDWMMFAGLIGTPVRIRRLAAAVLVGRSGS